jgi:hypothetical protein
MAQVGALGSGTVPTWWFSCNCRAPKMSQTLEYRKGVNCWRNSAKKRSRDRRKWQLEPNCVNLKYDSATNTFIC